jgi:hypothetical protein
VHCPRPVFYKGGSKKTKILHEIDSDPAKKKISRNMGFLLSGFQIQTERYSGRRKDILKARGEAAEDGL